MAWYWIVLIVLAALFGLLFLGIKNSFWRTRVLCIISLRLKLEKRPEKKTVYSCLRWVLNTKLAKD